MTTADLGDIGGSWAAIVFWHSLEHLRTPGATLRDAAARLMPGGVIVVAAPNLASLQARMFGARWLALDLPRHLVHLPAATLVEGMTDAGLKVERISYLRGGQSVFGWLHGLVGLLPGRPDLYDTIRRPVARRTRRGGSVRVLIAGALLLPIASVLAILEAVVRRGGTVYAEGRRG
jgi:hypothetical protein